MVKVIHADDSSGFIACKGKLVLLDQYMVIDKDLQCRKPIIISETEPMEVGAKVEFYGKVLTVTQHDPVLDKTIMYAQHENGNIIGAHKDNFRKILALSENFPPELLQQIADGKLKYGDQVLVACRHNSDREFYENGGEQFYSFVKLDSNNHIFLIGNMVDPWDEVFDDLDVFIPESMKEKYLEIRDELKSNYNAPTKK